MVTTTLALQPWRKQLGILHLPENCSLKKQLSSGKGVTLKYSFFEITSHVFFRGSKQTFTVARIVLLNFVIFSVFIWLSSVFIWLSFYNSLLLLQLETENNSILQLKGELNAETIFFSEHNLWTHIFLWTSKYSLKAIFLWFARS